MSEAAGRGEPPKYVQMVEMLKDGIRSGRWPLGAKLPSESDLIREFDCSRQVVIRAYQVLEQDGWIRVRGEPGRGRIVLGVPAEREATPGVERLQRGEVPHTDVTVKLLSVGSIKAPARAAHALHIRPGAPVVARQRLSVSAEIGPIELSTTYIPTDLAHGTKAGVDAPLAEGVLAHLRSRKRIAWERAEETIAARLPSTEEAELLEIGPRDALLTLLVVAYDRDDRPRLVMDILMPANRQVLEDAYRLT
jgi:GntR family transcriptional regulator